MIKDGVWVSHNSWYRPMWQTISLFVLLTTSHVTVAFCPQLLPLSIETTHPTTHHDASDGAMHMISTDRDKSWSRITHSTSTATKCGSVWNSRPDQHKRRRCRPCCESSLLFAQKNNDDMDRREAAFAMMGTLWAMTTGTGGLVGMMMSMIPNAAHASYGQEAKIQLPNPIDSLIQRASQDCVVESLGTRECLVYATGNKLYQGADGQLLLQRLQKAVAALSTIPELIQSKKWSAVNGVLTGPLGTLIANMNQLVKEKATSSSSSSSSGKAEQLAQQVKQDLFAIAAAVDKKQGDKALQSHEKASKDLLAFLQALDQP